MNIDSLSKGGGYRNGKHHSLYVLYMRAVSIVNRRHTEQVPRIILLTIQGLSILLRVSPFQEGENSECFKIGAAESFQVRHLCAIREIAMDRFVQYHHLLSIFCCQKNLNF